MVHIFLMYLQWTEMLKVYVLKAESVFMYLWKKIMKISIYFVKQ